MYTNRYNGSVDNRTRLLDVALDLFAARGYDAVGVQEVVEAAGLTKPTLYHYFGNKLGVLDALADWRGNALEAAIMDAVRYEGDLPLTLNRVVNAYFEQAQRDPTFHRLRMALWFAPPESEAGRLVGAQFAREAAAIEGLFNEAALHHGNMRGRAPLFATSLQGVVFAHVGRYLRGDARLGPELAFQAVHQFMHGIYS